MSYSEGYDLIITIVKKGFSENVLQASREAGAEGGTIIFGRGAGIHESAKILGIPIEPEKEIVMILSEKNSTDQIVEAIRTQMKIDEPGKGVLFILDVNKTYGLY